MGDARIHDEMFYRYLNGESLYMSGEKVLSPEKLVEEERKKKIRRK
jgi:hypothetical protein